MLHIFKSTGITLSIFFALFIFSACQQDDDVIYPPSLAVVNINGQTIVLNKWTGGSVQPLSGGHIYSVSVQSEDEKWVFNALGFLQSDISLPHNFDLQTNESQLGFLLSYFPDPHNGVSMISYIASDTTSGIYTITQANPASGGKLAGTLNYSLVEKNDAGAGTTSYNNTMTAEFNFGIE